jgi:hypothetical protein
MAVEVLEGAVVAHSRSRVGAAGGDLPVADTDAGIEHGGHEGVAHMCGCILGIRTPPSEPGTSIAGSPRDGPCDRRRG